MKKTTNSCPCCGSSLLRHVRHIGSYCFCQSCWQEVPRLSSTQTDFFTHTPIRQQPVSSQFIFPR
nr:hypothetical protein [Mastigocladopsis repens]